MATSNILLVFVFFIISFLYSLGNDIPSFVHACKRNSPDLSRCIINTFKEIRPLLIKGIPELNLPPADPLHFRNTTVSFGGSLTVNASEYNGVATGILNVDIKKLKLDLDQAMCSVTLAFPSIRFQGNYKFIGKLFLLQIDATGRFDVNTTDLISEPKLYGKFYNKAGKRFIKFENVTNDVKQVKVSAYFSNLVDNNEELTESLNKAINENFDIINQDVVPVIAEALSAIALEYFNVVFSLFPVDQLFPLT